MKYKHRNFCQVHNEAIVTLNKHNHKIPFSTRWLYVHLNLLENKFTGKKEDYFFRSLKDLSLDTQMSIRKVGEAIKELAELGLIQTWQMHWYDKKTGKKSEKHITAMRITEV